MSKREWSAAGTGFDRQKMSMLAVVGLLLDGSASPYETAPACRTNGIFCKIFGQGICELVIKCRNIGAVILSPID
jgi:hypothetical protein